MNKMNDACKITKHAQDGKYEVRLTIGKLIFGVCNNKSDLIKFSKKALVEEIQAHKKESNLLEKDIDNALCELDYKLNKLKRAN